jgi:parallel beta-helix repeat protein
VAPGLYFENVVIPFELVDVTLQGKGPGTVLEGHGMNASGAGDALVIEADGVTVRSMTIRNARAGAGDFGFGIDASGDDITINNVMLSNHEAGAILVMGDNARVTNCTANGCDGGIEVDGDNAFISRCAVLNDRTWGVGISGDGGTINKCKVQNAPDYGLWAEGSNNTIAGCTAVNGGSYPIWASGSSPTVTKNTVQGGAEDQYGVTFEDVAGGTIAGNRIADAAAQALLLDDGCSGVLVQNNQIVGGGLDAALVELGGSNHVFNENLVSNAGGNGVLVHGLGVTVTSNKIVHVAGTGLLLADTAQSSVVTANILVDCATDGLRNSGLNTSATENQLKDSRLDLTNDGTFAQFENNTYETGGPTTAPELE